MTIKTNAIVVNNLKYGDNSLIVDLYTEKVGKQTAFIKGALSKKSKMRAALFQPLNILETDLHHRTSRQMQRISNTQILFPLQQVHFNTVKSCIAMFTAEIIQKTLKEEEANKELFTFLINAVQTLDLNKTGTANFHIAFLIHYSRYLGFSLKHENMPMPQIADITFNNLSGFLLNKQQRNTMTEYLLGRYAAHIEDFGELKSFAVLQEVSNGVT